MPRKHSTQKLSHPTLRSKLTAQHQWLLAKRKLNSNSSLPTPHSVASPPQELTPLMEETTLPPQTHLPLEMSQLAITPLLAEIRRSKVEALTEHRKEIIVPLLREAMTLLSQTRMALKILTQRQQLIRLPRQMSKTTLRQMETKRVRVTTPPLMLLVVIGMVLLQLRTTQVATALRPQTPLLSSLTAPTPLRPTLPPPPLIQLPTTHPPLM
jgi:hypothetical protein